MVDKASSEDSQKRKELKTKEVSKKIIDSKMEEFDDFYFNCFAFYSEDNIKRKEEVVKSSSDNSFEYNGEEFENKESENVKEFVKLRKIDEKVIKYREAKKEKERE